MDTIIEGPQDDRDQIQDINIVGTASWNTHAEQIPNNSTLLYIAVEYVKDYKIDNVSSTMTSQPEVYSDFDNHVSPLDPNMSSVARYSPVYNESPAEYNPVVIHQLVTRDGTEQNRQFINNLNANSLGNIPTVLCNGGIREESSEYLQLVERNGSDIVNSNADNLHLVPEQEQEVELLITDEATGISYSVNAQELLVERCLQDEQHLLEALAPDPILESDLLAIDDRTLKSELNDDIDINVVTSVDTEAVDNYISSLSSNELDKTLGSSNTFKMETRQTRKSEIDPEEQMLSCVYSITDKPILTRARASLPESYLIINKFGEENAVFAKKTIPKRTQFGPLEGVLLLDNDSSVNDDEDKLLFLIKSEEVVYKIDVSDENTSNWMKFVRKARTFEEQNLVISQENNAIYFTSTTNISPKQELKVGYSSSYAQFHDLSVLQPQEERTWPCYECSLKFESSEELQNHLNVHDDERDENVKPRKKMVKNKKRFFKKYQSEAVECNICEEIFYQYNYSYLKLHVIQKHGFTTKGYVEDYFTVVVNYKCDICNSSFKSEALLKIHNLEHDPDSSDEQRNNVCPGCQRKFPTQRQLVMHVMQHSLPKNVVQSERVKCPICYKIFSQRERLQKHMLVHGSEESKPLQCKTCKKRFLNNSALACHIKTHFVGKNVFECPICKESFDHVLKLKLHVPNHCFNNSFTCPYCKKIFRKYSIIRKHIRAFHCERTHDCQHCSKVFPTLDKLRMHLLRHSDHREFLCADCGKQFKRKDKLTEHCKRIHSEERENTMPKQSNRKKIRKFTPKVEPTDFHRFIYKCQACLVGFKRRGMLVNHLAKRHPDIRPDSVPELNLPILQTTRDYYCQYCDKVYKSSSKRKAHILKNHPGAALPMSNRKQGSLQELSGLPNPTFSQTVGSITTRPQSCKWCHKQYASKAKLLQHQRKKHPEQMYGDVGCHSDMDNQRNGTSSVENDMTNSPKDSAVTEFDKVVENMMSNELDDYNLEEDSQYCHLSINENENFIQTGELENPNSHLYRLLTTNNGMLPPR